MRWSCAPGLESSVKDRAFTIYLTGTFRVKAPNGDDLTPKSKVRCAILAVLASSPNLTLSRTRLQTLFWGNSSAKQASGSLRSALFKLHQDFSSIDECVINSHTHHVSLSPELCRIIKAPEYGEFLEGLDVSLKGTDDFEDWLRTERMASPQHTLVDGLEYADKVLGVHHDKFPSPASSIQQDSIYTLGILPTDTGRSHGEPFSVTDAAIDSLVVLLSQLSTLSIFDLRGAAVTPGSLSYAQNAVKSLLLKSSAHNTGKYWALNLSLIDPQTGRIVFSLKPIIIKSADMSVDLSRSAEHILEAFMAEHGAGLPTNLMPWAALSSLFSLSSNSVEHTEAEIDRLLLSDYDPVLQTLKIFVQIFKQNEGLNTQDAYEMHDLQNALSQVPITSSLRPLCESLIGYSAHMLCAENDVSEFLLDTAFQRTPNLAINLDHLSALHFARGNLKAAVKYHEHCMRFSALSSWRYSYDISGAMISIALGDYRTALRHSNRALMQRPQFVGALRYTMIGFAMNEDPEGAHQMRSRISTLRPDYDLSGWIEALLRRSDRVFGNNVALTLKNLDLL